MFEINTYNLRAIILCVLYCFFLITPTFSQYAQNPPIQSRGEILCNAHRLSVSGTTLVDGFGNKVILVGAGIDWNEYSKGWFSIEDLQKIKSYGGNCVELHGLRVKQMMPQRDVIDEAYFVNNLDKWVSWCEQTQIYHIIDLREFKWASYMESMPNWMLDGHGYGSPPYSEATIDQAYIDFLDIDNPLHDDNRQSFINLWKFIANRYKANQYALFSIMNEPLANVPLTSTQASHLGITYSTFMEEVVDAIRSVGADHLVFIDAPYVTAVPRYLNNVQPVNRINIVWEDHYYVGPKANFTVWQSIINEYLIPKYVRDFQKPFYLGEYSPIPINMTGWRDILAQQVAYLKNASAGSEVAGYAWHTWGLLEGEYYDKVECNYLNQEESDYVIQTIFG